MRILTLVVDLDTVRICESTNIGIIDDNRTAVNAKFLPCVQGTFFNDFFNTINLGDIDAIFIFITNEKYLQSYSHELINEILVPKKFYKLASGNSIKTSKVNLDCMKYMLYCHTSKIQHFKINRKFNYKIKKLTKGKYGVIGMSFYATFEGSKLLYNILCFCLPHDNKNDNYHVTRAEKTLIIKNSIDKLTNKNMHTGERLILLGDFGYLLEVDKNDIPQMTIEELYLNDHLIRELNKHKYLKEESFIEGVRGEGINFFPTFKVRNSCTRDTIHGNDSSEYLRTCLEEHDSEIGWPIRTLYNQFSDIEEYRVVTYGNIKTLNNLGIYSIARV